MVLKRSPREKFTLELKPLVRTCIADVYVLYSAAHLFSSKLNTVAFRATHH